MIFCYAIRSQLVVMPLAADYAIKNINISFIVDHDRSRIRSSWVSKITASGYCRY